MRIAAIVLAAGEASRFGSPKQRILLPRVLERLRETSVEEIVVVEGAHELDLPSDTVSQGVRTRLVKCPEWDRGPGASLRCGLEALTEDVDVAVVVLADGPDVSPEAITRVLDSWSSTDDPTAASYHGERGHPLALGRSDWIGIPDEGLRDRTVSLVACDDLGAPGDVDTPDDLQERS